MTDDRDFKQLVRDRAAKTGESYQGARRQLERRRNGGFSARATQLFPTPSGPALGCIIERGEVHRGMTVTIASGGPGTKHVGVVVSLRHRWTDLETVRHDGRDEQFGLIVEPPYTGPVPARVTG